MNDDPLYAGFVRRRRFLIAVSLALAAASYLGLRIDEVNVLGNRANVGHPELLSGVGAVVWLWAVWSYVQWFHDFKAWQQTQTAVVAKRNQYLLRALRSPRAPPGQLNHFTEVRRQAVNLLPAREGMTASPENVFVTTQVDNIFANQNPGSKLLASCSLRAWLPLSPTGAESIGQAEAFTLEIGKWLHRACAARALAYVVVRTRYFSEFYAPFAVAAAPALLRYCAPCRALLGWL